MIDDCNRVGLDPGTLTLTAQVETHVLVPSETARPDDGVMTVRDPQLAAALRHKDEICADYSARKEEDAKAAAAAEETARSRF